MKEERERMKRVLIVNLTRMGDLVQTTPVLRGLKERHPGVEISLLVNSNFADICLMMPHVDRVVPVHISTLVERIRRGALIEAYREVETLLHGLNEDTYDLVINFTHTVPTALLISLIQAEEVRGLSIDGEGFTVKRHPWIRYFFNVVPNRALNPFHLCDIYMNAAGIPPKGQGLHLHLPSEMKQWARSFLRENGVEFGSLLVGLQLGASAEDKRWPVSCFVQVADQLERVFGARILLVGSEEEEILGQEFERSAAVRPLNLIGKTRLVELAALLSCCDLFISNDTGPLHIATAVGTLCVDISVGSVRARETGPYGDGHYVIEAELPCSPCRFHSHCPRPLCKEIISPHMVMEVVKGILQQRGLLVRLPPSDRWRHVQVYRSFFDEEGLIDYRPLIPRTPKLEEILRYLYRSTWLRLINGENGGRAESDLEGVLRKIRLWHRTRGVPGDVKADLVKVRGVLYQLRGLVDGGLSRATWIAKESAKAAPNLPWIQDLGEGLEDVEAEMETLALTHSVLKPLYLFFRYGKESLTGEDLRDLAEETAQLYKEMRLHIERLLFLIEGVGRFHASKRAVAEEEGCRGLAASISLNVVGKEAMSQQ